MLGALENFGIDYVGAGVTGSQHEGKKNCSRSNTFHQVILNSLMLNGANPLGPCLGPRAHMDFARNHLGGLYTQNSGHVLGFVWKNAPG